MICCFLLALLLAPVSLLFGRRPDCCQPPRWALLLLSGAALGALAFLAIAAVRAIPAGPSLTAFRHFCRFDG